MTSQPDQTTSNTPISIELHVGVIAERRPGVTRWQKTVIVPHAVFLADANTDAGPRVVYREGERLCYLAGLAPLQLHRKETNDYITNLQSNPPRVYVGLRAGEDANDETGWRAFLATVSPYEAEGYMHGAEEIVEPVAMPQALIGAIEDFVAAHHKSEPFKKRQRTKFFDPDFTPFARPPGWRETDQ